MRADGDGRKVDFGETVDPELQVREVPDDDELEHQHRREDGAADADFGEFMHGFVLLRSEFPVASYQLPAATGYR